MTGFRDVTLTLVDKISSVVLALLYVNYSASAVTTLHRIGSKYFVLYSNFPLECGMIMRRG